jgi:hypothetical protein
MLLNHVNHSKNKSPNQQRVLEIFDSLAQPIESYNIKLPAFLAKCKIVENRQVIQSQYSSACGFHCGFVLYHRLQGRKFKDIITEGYSQCNLRYNDRIARTLFKELCPVPESTQYNKKSGKCQTCRPYVRRIV